MVVRNPERNNEVAFGIAGIVALILGVTFYGALVWGFRTACIMAGLR